MSEKNITTAVAETLLSIKAVTLDLKKGYKWVSGIIAPIYCDNRLLMSYPVERQKIVDYFLQTIKDKNIKFDALAATATSGIPWAAWLAEKLSQPMVYVRSKIKDHGRENLIEGNLETGKRYLVIEDLISTGGSSLKTVEALKNAGGQVVACLAIFTYLFPEAQTAFTNAHCPLYTLSDFEVLINVAAAENYISTEEKAAALSWSADKTGWAKKVGLE